VTIHPSAPSKLETPDGTAHAIIGSLQSGRACYTVNGEPVDIDVTIPDDLADTWFWFGSNLTLVTLPDRCGLSICANTYPPPRCFEIARDVTRRERTPELVQERMF
jgi:hypothetical protein